MKTLKHYKAMEYRKTKDLLYVKEVLSHKNIQNILVYTHLVNFELDEWICKVTSVLDEYTHLIEARVQYVTDYEEK